MKGKIEVVIPRPKTKEWEEPIIPQISNFVKEENRPGTVDRVPESSATSLETVRNRGLTQKLSKVLSEEESLNHSSLTRKELEKTFNNYKPVLLDIVKDELQDKKPKTEEEKKQEEVQEVNFLEQQRTSSLSSRAKSRSNKHTPESNKNKDTESYNTAPKCFSKLDFDEDLKPKIKDNLFTSQNRISEDEREDETQYSQSVDTMNSYKPINKQSPF